jgi:hypothetical protein
MLSKAKNKKVALRPFLIVHISLRQPGNANSLEGPVFRPPILVVNPRQAIENEPAVPEVLSEPEEFAEAQFHRVLVGLQVVRIQPIRPTPSAELLDALRAFLSDRPLVCFAVVKSALALLSLGKRFPRLSNQNQRRH